MNMKKLILDITNNANSNSSDDTDSTQTQCSSVVLPPIRNSNTFDSLVERNRINHLSTAAVGSGAATQDHHYHHHHHHHQLNKQSTFRKCQSFIHLSKTSDRVHSSLTDTSGNCDRLRKASSTPTAIYMAIKQEQDLLVHRIFRRCKVNLICCFALLLAV